ncbi:MAG: NADH-dependent dehydrogenase [Planctomycetaceae bacterium]|nr:MAG: NADH-dependent dehydrogenase [Planctomycetaceae bacterium]
MEKLTRRDFFGQSALTAAATLAPAMFVAARQSDSPGEPINCGVMGLGRGMAHVASILDSPQARLKYVCDVDRRRLEAGMKNVENRRVTHMPTPLSDFRRMLDDPHLHAVFIATCNHWHAPATIMACAAGKHVYVEKPGSHNPHEGELMVAAARKYRRVVQMGNQRRSWPAIIEAIDKLRAGAIGRVLYARAWYNNQRGSIGKGKHVPVPDYLDYDLWQGPAPERPYKDNLIPYNWHWHWHYGGGELANNGIHALDLVRWGLGVDYPLKVSYIGGRFHYDDDQETPDTGTAAFHFGSVGGTWECSSCLPRREEKHPFVAFYGSEGALHIVGTGYVIYDLKGEKVAEGRGEGGDLIHIKNFLECIASGKKPNSEIEEGQKSTLLCHLGNISYRVGRTIYFDPQTRKIVNDHEAMNYWQREYRPGWEPHL